MTEKSSPLQPLLFPIDSYDLEVIVNPAPAAFIEPPLMAIGAGVVVLVTG